MSNFEFKMELLIVVVIKLCCSEVLATVMPSTTLINGPDPMNAVAPVGSTVAFTCVVNSTELPLLAMVWIVDGAYLSGSITIDQLEMTNGSSEIGVLQLTVSQNYTAGVLVQCAVVQESTVYISNTNATLTAYGEMSEI